MPRLSQVLATEKHHHAEYDRRMTEVHRQLAKPSLLEGIEREYQPDDEINGEHLPSEGNPVQLHVEQVLNDLRPYMARVFDIVATKDHLNATNLVDVTIEGDENPTLTQVSPPHLLWLERRLATLHEFIRDLPIRDRSKRWQASGATESVADPVKTSRTKKVPRNHVLAEATEKHPAQVQMYYEDVKVGVWTRTDYTGAISIERRETMLNRVTALLDAVKVAREEANARELDMVREGRIILDYLLA